MLVNIKILNRPEVRTVNGRVYAKESYITKINEYIKSMGGALYSYQSAHYTGGIPLEQNNPEDQIGNVKSLGDDFIFSVEISDEVYEKIKDELDSYYIMIRLIAHFIRDGISNRVYVDRVLGMDLHNDPKNIAKII